MARLQHSYRYHGWLGLGFVLSPLKLFQTYFSQHHWRLLFTQFPVINARGALSGILTLDMIRKVIQEEQIFELVIAKDLSAENFLTVTPQDDLNAALDKLIKIDQEEILVVDSADQSKILTMLSRRHIIIAYNREIEKQKSR